MAAGLFEWWGLGVPAGGVICAARQDVLSSLHERPVDESWVFGSVCKCCTAVRDSEDDKG